VSAASCGPAWRLPRAERSCTPGGIGHIPAAAPRPAISSLALSAAMTSITKTAQILSDVETTELLSELQRRLNCAVKPEKHVILVGGWREPAPRPPRLLRGGSNATRLASPQPARVLCVAISRAGSRPPHSPAR